MCNVWNTTQPLVSHFPISSVILLPETVQNSCTIETNIMMILFQWYGHYHALLAHLALLSRTTPSYDVKNLRHTFFMINAPHYLKKLSLLFQFKSKITIHLFRMV